MALTAQRDVPFRLDKTQVTGDWAQDRHALEQLAAFYHEIPSTTADAMVEIEHGLGRVPRECTIARCVHSAAAGIYQTAGDPCWTGRSVFVRINVTGARVLLRIA